MSLLNDVPETASSRDAKPSPMYYVWSASTVVVLTLLGVSLGQIITPIDQALIYLMGVVFVAAKFGRGPSFLCSLLSVCSFNFFFIPPIYSFTVYDRSYWLTFIVMMITSFVITSQASRLRLQAVTADKRERDTQELFSLTKKLTSTQGQVALSEVSALHIGNMFNVDVVVWLSEAQVQLKKIAGDVPVSDAIKEVSVLQWCFENLQIAGRHTETMSSALGLYFPLIAVSGTLGVMGVFVNDSGRDLLNEEKTSLEICARLLASALERSRIANIAEQSKIEAESQKLRTMLLSSVSHDLRTPLASITGASSTIVVDIERLSREAICDLGGSINKEAERLSRLVTNLLEATRLESGAVQLNRQPYFVEELIGSVLARKAPQLAQHHVLPKSEENQPLVFVDGVMIEQVLDNLLENAVRYTPVGSTIMISTLRKGASILIKVADNGPGIPEGNEERIFHKFYSMNQRNSKKGTGLGLAICASIIKAHKGELWSENNLQGGACFCFTLPLVRGDV